MSNEAARGDTRPCTHGGCQGTMQYGREPMPPSHGRESNGGAPGWVCSARVDHFTAGTAAAIAGAAANASARSSWADDGGSSE